MSEIFQSVVLVHKEKEVSGSSFKTIINPLFIGGVLSCMSESSTTIIGYNFSMTGIPSASSMAASLPFMAGTPVASSMAGSLFFHGGNSFLHG